MNGFFFPLRALALYFALTGLTACGALHFGSSSDQNTPQQRRNQEAEAYRGRFFLPPSENLRKPELPAPDLFSNRQIKRELSFFLKHNRRFTGKALLRVKPHYPMIQQIFRDEGVPRELIGLGLVESGFQSDVISSAGAAGMWQFMKATGRSYGLKSTWAGDDRKDVLKSTRAAARHLRDLYEQFEDWNLALAAYNAGSGRVSKAIRKHGVRDFWKLEALRALPAQTRRYVPKVLAAARIMDDPTLHGFREYRRLS